MGYSTDFNGSFGLSRPLTETEKNYINCLASTRRVKRDSDTLMKLYKGEHGIPTAKEKTAEAIYGTEGEFFCKDDGNFGQTGDESVLDGNNPASTQPGLWCQWVINNEGTQLEWDGGEKFYNYTQWLEYIIENFLKPWGVIVNGETEWQGEESDDFGKIIVTENEIKILEGRRVYE
jgi:hypothetical protein